jgi:hypothetical protein
MDEKKIAERIEEVWGALESIATEIDGSRELRKELCKVEALFKFARTILEDRERILDSKFHICFYGNEVAVEATFGGVHMHTLFLKLDDKLSDIRQFTDPKIVMKSALALLAWALRDSAQAIMDWHAKHF